MKPALGVLGGLGPLASAEFVNTIYEHNPAEVEQDSPAVILLSDPGFPDRALAFRSRADDVLINSLAEGAARLFGLNVSKIVICCMSLHYVLPNLSPDFRNRTISLVDLTIEGIAKSGRKQLLLCAPVTREAHILENHPDWSTVKDLIVMPDETDQETVCKMIRHYKTNNNLHPFLPHLSDMLARYRADSFIAGCSELHILTRHLSRRENNDLSFVDPLFTVASNLPRLL
jgi:aspartate racemase